MSGAAPPDADVLIVGAGPVGLLLACELTLRGVRTAVVERRTEPLDAPRAGTLHARTVQTLRRRGFGPLLAPAARRDDGEPAPFPFAGLGGLRIAAPPGEGPAVADIPQLALERAFEARAQAQGATVLRGCEAVAAGQDEDGAWVEVRAAGPAWGADASRGAGAASSAGDASVADAASDGEAASDAASGGGAVLGSAVRRLRAAWLVGADGARGLVARAGGFDFATEPATVDAVLARARLLDPWRAPAGWRMTRRGWTLLNVAPAGWSRVIAADFAGPAADRRAPVSDEELRAAVARVAGVEIPIGAVAVASRFSDHSRVADRYRDGRLLLAGDAAHVHFPVGGQGLNTGLQDAVALGWRLAAIVRHGAPAALLDEYDAERRPVAEQVVAITRAQVALMRPEPELDPVRSLVAALLPLPDVSAALGGLLSGQAVRTAAGAGFVADVPLADGRRLSDALADGRGVLLLCAAGGEPLAAAAAPWADAVEIATAADAPGGERLSRATLVRADGYAAWTGEDPAALRAALARCFGGRPAAARALRGRAVTVPTAVEPGRATGAS